MDEDEKKEEKAAIKAENRLEWLNKAFDELKKASISVMMRIALHCNIWNRVAYCYEGQHLGTVITPY